MALRSSKQASYFRLIIVETSYRLSFSCFDVALGGVIVEQQSLHLPYWADLRVE